jgi:hypothetical protein
VNLNLLTKAFAATTACAILAACQHPPRFQVITVPAPTVLPTDQGQSVWFPDQIAPYSVGRYVDPRDHNVVHEAHTIYRREQTSRPNLSPPEALVFPPVASRSASNVTVMLRDALSAELNQQRAASRALIEQAQALDKYVRQLNAQTQDFREALQESARVRAQLQAISNRLEILEGQLRASPPLSSGPPAFGNSFPVRP